MRLRLIFCLISLFWFGIADKNALGANAVNLGTLLDKSNFFFVPFSQSNPITKPKGLSFVPRYVTKALELALDKEQVQPLIQ